MPGQPLDPVVFAYNFPHKKTQDFLLRMVLLDMKPQLVLLADPVKLNIPPAAFRTKPRFTDLIHPRVICERFGINYQVISHANDHCVSLLKEHRPKLGVVSGARILPRKIIDCFSVGIVNFHPGMIPEARGLDALLWSLHLDLPLGVTAHLIDSRVDAGKIIERKEIEIFADDTFVDLSLRLHELQVQMLPEVLAAVASGDSSSFELVSGGEYRRSFPAELAASLPQKLSQRLTRLRCAAKQIA